MEILIYLYIAYLILSWLYEKLSNLFNKKESSGYHNISNENVTISYGSSNKDKSLIYKYQLPQGNSGTSSWDIDINQRHVDPNSSWGEIRTHVFNKYLNKCRRCRSINNLTVHHKIEKSLGGDNTLENLELLCKDCHEEIHKRSIFDDLRHFKNIDNYDKDYHLSNKIKIISNSIRNGNTINIKYVDIENRTTTRVIKPLNLFREFKRIYLRAYCFLRNAERTFRVKRISILKAFPFF